MHLVTSNRAPGKETKNDVRTEDHKPMLNVIKKRRLVSDVELSLIFMIIVLVADFAVWKEEKKRLSVTKVAINAMQCSLVLRNM